MRRLLLLSLLVMFGLACSGDYGLTSPAGSQDQPSAQPVTNPAYRYEYDFTIDSMNQWVDVPGLVLDDFPNVQVFWHMKYAGQQSMVIIETFHFALYNGKIRFIDIRGDVTVVVER